MLTVSYDKLGLQPGNTLLDLGAGLGRHSFEAFRRGANVIACDLAKSDLTEVQNLFGAMIEVGEAPSTTLAASVCGDATLLPFPSDSFDHIIASEVMEHIPNDTEALEELFRICKPGGTIAITVPAWFPEKVCWKLTDEYYAPKAVGGHVRIYKKKELAEKITQAGFTMVGSQKAHALHSPYWWLKCAVGIQNNDLYPVKKYNKMLVWDIEKSPWITRSSEKLLNPLLGKSIVMYAQKRSAIPLSEEGARD